MPYAHKRLRATASSACPGVPSGKQVVFLGGGKRGILYGVYHYIEEKLGVRWWNRQEEYIPARKKLPVPEKTLLPWPANREAPPVAEMSKTNVFGRRYESEAGLAELSVFSFDSPIPRPAIAVLSP